MKNALGWWKSQRPEQKRNILLALLVGVILFFAWALEKTKPRAAEDTGRNVRQVETVSAVVTPERKDPSVTEMDGKVAALENKMDQFRNGEGQQLRQGISATQDELKRAQEQRDADSRLMAETIKNLQDELKIMKSGVGPGGSRDNLSLQLPPLPGENASAAPLPPGGARAGDIGAAAMTPAEPPKPAKPRLRVIGGDDDEANQPAAGANLSKDEKDALQKAAIPRTFLPAGAIIEGILLNGMDAPTSNMTAKNPVPAVVRVKKEAILPNRQTADIRECFIIVSGFGVLATERAQLRTETLSCILADGGVVENEISGYVIGEDGKAGMRGRLVSKQGSVIAKSLIAGFASGLGSLAPTTTPSINIGNGSSDVSRPNLNAAGESAAYKGISSAATQISTFYLDMAREMFPVVEIDAARSISIVLVKGLWLATAKGPAT